ncbi:MAG TPA: response regulator transcription factor [Longimicrobiales bacterium]|nr:response regulator transcription factor [Longimicrobiales bacterium]
MTRVLVVEDDAAILRGLRDNLAAESYDVTTAADGEAAYAALRKEEFDLVILDLMLPKLSGYEICQRARAEGIDVPILMLTARGTESDRVLGLDMGADDYVTKPFSVRELLARVRALLRRGRTSTAVPEELTLGGVTVDFRSFEATRAGAPIRLTRKEFGTLRYLAARRGEAVRRDELLKEVWHYKRLPTTRTVDNHVASLRAKIEDDPSEPAHLITVHGVGYKLVW